jgi:hypothetical protein
MTWMELWNSSMMTFCLKTGPAAKQKALYRWQLDWQSLEKDFEGRSEKRRGVDVLHFRDGKIIQKLTYSKTTIEIDGRRVRLLAV